MHPLAVDNNESLALGYHAKAAVGLAHIRIRGKTVEVEHQGHRNFWIVAARHVYVPQSIVLAVAELLEAELLRGLAEQRLVLSRLQPAALALAGRCA